MSGRIRVQGSSEQTTDWTASHAPAANTQATATRAAAGLLTRNICTGITVVIVGGAIAPTALTLTVRLIDGASGGASYLWQAAMSVPAVAGAVNGICRQPVWIVGSPNTSMTLEFSVAGGANTVESVSMEGTTS